MKKEQKNIDTTPKMNKKVLDGLKKEVLPYNRIYPSIDIFECNGVFSKTYMIKDMDYLKAKDMETMEFFLKYKSVLNNIKNDFDIELTIFNKNESINKATKAKYLIADNTKATELVDEYNTFITSFLNKRNINTQKEKYLTLSIKGDVVDDVIPLFQEAEIALKNSINDIADASIGIVSTTKRLELLYDIFNPQNEEHFKEKLILTDNLDAQVMKKKKITSKDMIFPNIFNVCDSFVELDKQYCRSLYLSDIPSSLSENIVSDITNINIPMITSIHFKPIDPSNALKNLIADREKMKKEILEERKKQAKKNNKTAYKLYRQTEEKEFLEEIQVSNVTMDIIEEELKAAIANNEKLFFVNMCLTHYNDTLEGLDDDTNILQSFLQKILCKMDKCIYNQKAGFVSSLPLGINKVQSDRVFNSLDSSYFTPFNPQDILRKNGLNYGINTINKDLVVINRKNSKNPSGFILGTTDSEREVEVKREMLLNYMSSKDRIVMISSSNKYDKFFEAMEGDIIDDLSYNVLTTHELYSDSEEPEVLKYKYLVALLTALNKGALTKEEKNLVKDICAFIVGNDFLVCMQDVIEAFQEDKYSKILGLIQKLDPKYLGPESDNFSDKDFVLFKTNGSLEDMLIKIDYCWNYMIDSISKNRRTWIFIDDIELMFKYLSTSSFLTQLFNRCNFFETILTFTTENTHILINNCKQSDAALSMLQNSGYIKLLNTGVLDRDILQKYLNITSIHLPYITGVKPGQGIILTPECNFSFLENMQNTKFYNTIIL